MVIKPPSYDAPFTVYAWYRKLVEVLHATEEGIFAEGQLPDDYGGSDLKIEVIRYVILTDEAGHLLVLEFFPSTAEKALILDKDREAGMGLKVTWLPPAVEGMPVVPEEVEAPSGPSDQFRRYYERENDGLAPEVLARARAMHFNKDKQDNPDDYPLAPGQQDSPGFSF